MVFSIIQLERARASSWAVLQKSARKPRCLQAGDEWPPPAKKPWQARQVNGVLVSQRWPSCACGIGPVQRDLYSAWLAAHLHPPNTIPSIAQDSWEGAELRLQAAVEVLQQRAKEGQVLPRSVGIPRARARLPESLAPNQQGLVYRHGRIEALG